MTTAPAAFHLPARQPARRRVHDLDFGDGGLAHALDFFQPRARRRDHLGEGAERRNQIFGERFDVALRNGAEQHQFEQLVITDRLAAGLAKTRAQSLAVAMIMRRRFGKPVLAPLFGHDATPTPAPENRSVIEMGAIDEVIITLTKQTTKPSIPASNRDCGHDCLAQEPDLQRRDRSPRMAGSTGLAERSGLPALRRCRQGCDQAGRRKPIVPASISATSAANNSLSL